MKNLYLFQPNFRQPFHADSNDQFVEGCYFVPYSVASLWAFAKQHDAISKNYELKKIVFKREPFSKVLDNMEPPHVAAFSCYTWCWEYNVGLARLVKERYPDALIVFGGPMVPDDSKDFFAGHRFVDIVVHAEGEHAFLEILGEALNKAPDFSGIAGISINQHLRCLKTKPRARILALDELPNPYLAGVFDDLIKENPYVRWNATIETTRGCPFQCSFCDWGSQVYAKVRKFKNETVRKVLDWCAKNKIEFIHVADANFGAFKKQDEEIVDHVINLRQKTGYPFVFCATWHKNCTPHVIRMIRKLTVNQLDRGLTLSVQSMSDKVLKAVNRRNMGTQDLKRILKICSEQQIPSYTELIIGLPEETFESWRQGLCSIIELGQHNSIDVWLGQLLVNAELNSLEVREKYQIKTIITKKYQGCLENTEDVSESAELISSTSTMPFDDYIKSYMYAWCIINFHSYGWTQVFSRFLRNFTAMEYADFYDRLFAYAASGSKGFLHEMFMMTKGVITAFLKTGLIEEGKIHSAIGKNILGDSQRHFHVNREKVWEDLAPFFEGWSALDPFLMRGVLAYQMNFVTDPQKSYPYTVEFDFNLFEYLEQSDSLVKGNYSYEFRLIEEFIDLKDYIGKLYFRRNVGWGKAKVQLANIGIKKVPDAFGTFSGSNSLSEDLSHSRS